MLENVCHCKNSKKIYILVQKYFKKLNFETDYKPKESF